MTKTGATRILLADDHGLVRRGLRLILDGEPDLEVAAEAADGRAAVDLATTCEIDLAILDIAMPRMTGLQAGGRSPAGHPGVRLLMLSMYDNEQISSRRSGPGRRLRPQVRGRSRVGRGVPIGSAGDPFVYAGKLTALIQDYQRRSRNGDRIRPAS